MYILGISALYHDSAACLVHNGEIISAAQEERFTRIKHDSNFPVNAIQFCLEEAKINPSNIDNIVFYEKPFPKFERLLETYLAFAPRGFRSFSKAMPIWIKEKLFQKSAIVNELKNSLGTDVNWTEKLLFSEHHLSHAASAFFPSPFDEAAILTLDGVGEWATTTVAVGKGNNLRMTKEIRFPHSLGLLYSAFTYFTGYKVNSGEYKVMGLAPYGEPKYVDLIFDNLIHLEEDGSFQLDMSYFDYCTGLTMTNKKFDKLFGGPRRKPESELTQREMDLAASIQVVTEQIIVQLARNIAKETKQKNLCLAGGVALNCVANGVLLREKIFEQIWIQPAAGDAGGALGAALAVSYMMHDQKRETTQSTDQMNGSYLGPSYNDDDVLSDLTKLGASFDKLDELDIIDEVAKLLADGKAIGWMQGRMEFGPRSLGNRSILGDPKSPKMQKQLNLKVKYRESFRPFAPSVLFEHVNEWFELDQESPYMLFVADVKSNKRIKMSEEDLALFGIDKLNIIRSDIPAVTHVDYSARVQTVHSDTNPKYHNLISKFNDLTGCPVIVNTSFNVRGEPIVCNPTDAFRCFMNTELDALVINNFLLLKENQTAGKSSEFEVHFDLD
ncbi:MAG: carbamoyltransferase [Lentilitoribacter sp.]